MTPYTALVARAMLLGRITAELKYATGGNHERLIELRDMATTLLIEGMRDRKIMVPWDRVQDEYARKAWQELQEAMDS